MLMDQSSRDDTLVGIGSPGAAHAGAVSSQSSRDKHWKRSAWGSPIRGEGRAISIERELVTLGRALEVPETPELTTRVSLIGTRRRVRERRRWALAVALVLVAALAAALAIPDARSTLLRVLRIGGERIVRVDELPPVEAEPRGLGLALGEELTLAQARARAGFPLRELEGSPTPDHVYLGTRGTVWFLWGTPLRVRLLVAQTSELTVGSSPLFEKLVAQGTEIEPVSVGGRPGWFISGTPHVVYLLDARGEPVEEVAWLAENVLVWEEDGVTVRMEGAIDADRAIELAASLR